MLSQPPAKAVATPKLVSFYAHNEVEIARRNGSIGARVSGLGFYDGSMIRVEGLSYGSLSRGVLGFLIRVPNWFYKK